MGQPPSQPPPPGTIEDDLAPTLQDGNYPSGEQHAAALLTVAGETHLVQGGPNFLRSPSTSQRPTRLPTHARSLTPAVCSAFPNAGFMEYKGLATEITELINNREKESCQCLAQQERWIEGLQNHIRKLYAHIEAARCAAQSVAMYLEIQGLPSPSTTLTPQPVAEPFGLYQPTLGATASASATTPLEPGHPF